MWRDEVRALSLALNGNDLMAMLQGVHGEGHPALWYLLLRAAYAVVGRPEVLPALALVVAVAAALLLVLKSPFPWPMIGLILLGHFFLFEYSVMARNYGIAMLVLFAVATYYPAYRSSGIALGVLLFLLANCNVFSAILTGAFLLFWLVDILPGTEFRWSRSLRHFTLNAVIAGAGVTVCALTIFPTFNDASVPDWSGGLSLKTLAAAVLNPAVRFEKLLYPPNVLQGHWRLPLETAGSLLLFGSTLGLVGRPGAFLAALSALIAFSVFFAIVGVGPGYPRHAMMWLAFLISLYWICWDTSNSIGVGSPEPRRDALSIVATLGFVLFIILLGLQAVRGVRDVQHAMFGDIPFSRSADFAAFLARRPDLKDAILIADPDYLLEPLPYYLDNKTYLMRQQRYGNVVAYTKKARLNLGLDDVLQNGRTLHDTTGKPVVILLGLKFGETAPQRVHSEGYDWTLTTTPEQVRTFQDATVLLHRFEPASSDETFDAYLLK